MKAAIALFTSIVIVMQCAGQMTLTTSSNPSVQISGNDSIIFDVTEADCFFDKIQFPLYINSDDEIFAIDFAMKFDVTLVAYDSMIILKPYLLASINYNTADSTLRFSCFTIQPVDNGDALINLRFRKLTPVIDTLTFNHVNTYLNGDSCSNHVSQYISRPILTPAGPLSINTGDSITLEVNPQPGYSYLWSTGDTSTSIRISSQGLYAVTATNMHGCTAANSIMINPGIPLPVELLYFRCNSNNDNIRLEWATASETENDFFTVEKVSSANEWALTIPGSGNSLIPLSYELTDKKPETGVNYYRLKQTDYNGRSEIIGYTACSYKNDFKQFIAYPNPAHDKLYIESSESGILTFYSITGERRAKPVIINSDKKLVINKGLPEAGIYIIKLEMANDVLFQKIIIE